MASLATNKCPKQYQYSNNLCTHVLKTEVQCHLGNSGEKKYNDAGTLIQPCYNADGSINNKNGINGKIPNAAAEMAENPKPQTLGSMCSTILPFGDSAVGENNSVLMSNIKQLQQDEQQLLEQLQNTVNKKYTSQTEQEVSQILAKLKPIQTTRVKLMQQLQSVASQTQCSLAGDRRSLQDQVAMLLVAENQLKSIEKQTEDLVNSRNQKRRQIQIVNYEYDRYESHKDIFKILAFTMFFILGGISIHKTDLPNLAKVVIIAASSIGIILIGLRIMWNSQRSSMNWNQFNWDLDTGKKSGYETVWEHDKKAFSKGWAGLKSEAKSLEQRAENTVNKVERGATSLYNTATQKLRDATDGIEASISSSSSVQSTGVGKTRANNTIDAFTNIQNNTIYQSSF